MGIIFHIIFVVLVNIIGWGMLIIGVVGFFWALWVTITGKGLGGSDNIPGL